MVFHFSFPGIVYTRGCILGSICPRHVLVYSFSHVGNFNRCLGSGLPLRNRSSDSRPRMELSSGWLLAPNTRHLLLGLPWSPRSTWLHSFHLLWATRLASLPRHLGGWALTPSQQVEECFSPTVSPATDWLSLLLPLVSQAGWLSCVDLATHSTESTDASFASLGPSPETQRVSNEHTLVKGLPQPCDHAISQPRKLRERRTGCDLVLRSQALASRVRVLSLTSSTGTH